MAGISSASAQFGGRASFSAPDLSRFPEISFYLTAFDAEGNFIEDLRPGDIVINEDGQEQPAAALEKVEPGLEIVIAFNNGPYMTNQTGGVSRYQAVQAALLAWLQNQSGKTDELSVLSNSGLYLTRSASPQEWARALQEFTPDLANTRAGLGSLSQALDMGTDPLTDPNMKRVILYITLMPDANTTAALPNLAARAQQQGTRVYVWLVAPDQTQLDAGYLALNDLALSTGGQMFLFHGQNSLPDPEAYFRPLRYLYRVSYLSALRQSGEYRLEVSVEQPPELFLQAGSARFSLYLRPPNPIFIAPPSSLQRAWTAGSAEVKPVLTPDRLNLQILVEFSDKITRDLAYSRLLVDGVVVDENRSAPFDSLSWDLSAETASAGHILQVEVGDVFGLSQKTIELPLSIQVPEAPRLSLLQIIPLKKLALYGGIGLAGIALLAGVMLAGRRVRRSTGRKQDTDPLTQRVPIKQERPARKQTVAQSAERRWFGRAASSAPARLARHPQADAHAALEPEANHDLPLSHRETTFGSDPQQAMVVLESSSVSGLHARMLIGSDGKFSLADAGSVAGTWVNYAPVSQQGAQLEHGDLVHIGGLAYRFLLSNPPKARQPRSQPQDEEL